MEAETRQRLKSLLGLILTSSKNDQEQLIDQSEVVNTTKDKGLHDFIHIFSHVVLPIL